jgi:fibronectin-binding autotransporter adhesin
LAKSGAGTITLSADNSGFTGTVAISAGQIIMGNANALGPTDTTTAITISGTGSLDIQGNTLGTRLVNVAGSGDGTGAIVSNGGAENLNALRSVTLTDNTTFGGSVRWDIRGTDATLVGNGKTLTKKGSYIGSIVNVGETDLGDIFIYEGALAFEGTTTMGDPDKTVTVDATGDTGAMLAMWGNGENILNKKLILKNGGSLGQPSTWTNAGTNTFGGSVTLDGGGTLAVSSGTTTIVSGAINGAGGLTKTDFGTAILTSTANSWGGGTTITGSTLQIGDGGANGSLPGTGTITVDDYIDTTVEPNVTYTGTLSFNTAGDLAVANIITGTGGITKTGTGTVTLSGSNSYSGTTAVNNGVLKVTDSLALGYSSAITIAGGTSTARLELAKDASDLNISNSSITLSGRQPETTPAAHIVNTSGNNTYAGDVNFATGGNQYILQSDAGKLSVYSVTDGLTTDRYLVLQGAGDGDIYGGINVTDTENGTLHLVKDGSGTWTLSSSSNYHNGTTTIRAGTLALGDFALMATTTLIDVQAGGTFDVSAVYGGFILSSGQTLGGNGTVKGSVFTSGSATNIAPGSSVGTLTFEDNLTFYGYGDSIVYEISGANGDLLEVQGDLTFYGGSGSETIIDPTILSAPTAGTYRVANVTGYLTGSDASVIVPDNGHNFTRFTFTPSVTDGAGGTIDLIVSGSNANLEWDGTTGSVWDVRTTSPWYNTGTSSADMYYQADDVTFNDRSSYTTVDISTTVKPQSVTVSGTSNYTFSGTGKISGLTGLTKNGTGTLTINTANDYTGQTVVNNGVLQFGASAAYTSLTGDIVVNNGASLDMQAFSGGPTPIPTEIKISGAGYNGQGALYATTAPEWEYNLVMKLELVDDATISTGAAWRWDMINPSPGDPTAGYLKGNGKTLTKIGTGEIWIKRLGETDLGDVNINAGRIGFQEQITAGRPDYTITVATDASLGLWDTGQYQTINKKLVFQDGSTFYSGGGNGNSWTGNTTLNGNVNFITDVNLTWTAASGDKITGTGGITKQNGATLTLAGDKDFSGANDIQAGSLALGDTGTLGDINDATDTILTLLADSDHTVGNITGTGSTVLEANAQLTVTSITQDTLTLGAGAKLTIAAITSGSLAGGVGLSAIPEPSTWTLLLLAGLGLGLFRRRSRKA